MIPGLNDHEMPRILEAAAEHGATMAGYTMLRTPHAVGELFDKWLAEHYPLKRDRVLRRVGEASGGPESKGRFHTRMRGTGPYADNLAALFQVTRRRLGLDRRAALSTASFRRPAPSGQIAMFET
jgi:DNA repair photolyase